MAERRYITVTITPDSAAPEPVAMVSDEVASARLAICLACSFAHAKEDGTHKCMARCCGAVANSVERGVKRRSARCLLGAPKW